MEAKVTVNLPSDLKRELDEAVQETGKPPNELMCEALRDYLFIHKFRLLREHMIPRAQAQGIYTDEDAFDRIS